MKLSRSVLKGCDAPSAVGLGSNEGLYSVDGRVDVGFSRGDHPPHRSKEGDFRAQKADLASLADVNAGRVTGEDLTQLGRDFGAAVELTAVEADGISVGIKEIRHSIGIP